MDAQDLGRFAKEQRREAGLSQRDVTLLADVSEPSNPAQAAFTSIRPVPSCLRKPSPTPRDSTPGDAATSSACSRIAAGCGALRP